MIRTLSINRLKHHLPKWKVISLFLPPTIFDKTSCLSYYMQKKRVAWHPKERLPMKLAVIRSENIEVYISFNNSIQGNGQSWTNETSVRSLLQTTRCDKTPHLLYNALKKCVAWHPQERLPMIDTSSYSVRKYRNLSLIQETYSKEWEKFIKGIRLRRAYYFKRQEMAYAGWCRNFVLFVTDFLFHSYKMPSDLFHCLTFKC